MQYFSSPRPHWFHQGPIGSPVIVALHGFLSWVGPPAWWRLNNFVEHSRLLTLGDRTSLCFPVGKWRNWGWPTLDADYQDLVEIASQRAGGNLCFLWGHSDGATMTHHFTRLDVDAIVAHSGFFPEEVELGPESPPCLLICGSNDRTPVKKHQEAIKQRYLDAGVPVDYWIPFDNHAWAHWLNGSILDWCLDHSKPPEKSPVVH